VHLRRALLLFAIVLAMAALAASLSRPLEPRRAPVTHRQAPDRAPSTVTARPPSPVVPAPLELDAARHGAVRVAAGDAATLEVSVPAPGVVAIPDMGLSDTADRFTPARFEIFASSPGRYELRFTPAGSGSDEPAGRLVVTSRG
jgi:hypothetical protein